MTTTTTTAKVIRAVIGVPAYFGESQRAGTLRASLAGVSEGEDAGGAGGDTNQRTTPRPAVRSDGSTLGVGDGRKGGILQIIWREAIVLEKGW